VSGAQSASRDSSCLISLGGRTLPHARDREATMVNKEFTAEEAAKVADSLGIDLAAEGIELEQFRMGLGIELEHGRGGPGDRRQPRRSRDHG
jgi:hypothetical protein